MKQAAPGARGHIGAGHGPQCPQIDPAQHNHFWQTTGNCGAAKQWGLRYRTPQGDLCQDPTKYFRGARRGRRGNPTASTNYVSPTAGKPAPRLKRRSAKLIGAKALSRAMPASRRITDPNFPQKGSII